MSDTCAYGTTGCRNTACTRDYCRLAHSVVSHTARYAADPAPHGYDAIGLPLDQEVNP